MNRNLIKGNVHQNEYSQQLLSYINYLENQLKQEQNKNEQSSILIQRLQNEVNNSNLINQENVVLQEKYKLLQLKNKLIVQKNSELENQLTELTQQSEDLKQQIKPLLEIFTDFKELKQEVLEMNRRVDEEKKQLMIDAQNLIITNELKMKEHFQKQLDAVIKEKESLLDENSSLKKLLLEYENSFEGALQETQAEANLEKKQLLALLEELEDLEVLEDAEIAAEEEEDLELITEIYETEELDQLVEDHIQFVEQTVDEEQFADSMNKLLSETVSVFNDEPASAYRVSEAELALSGFKPRTDQWEYDYLNKVEDYIGEMYRHISSHKSRNRDDMDYASAYTESILRSGQHKKLQVVEEMLAEPYFGRVDLESDDYGKETFYIGTHGVEGYVINWQADLAKAYYYKTVGTPVKLEKMGEITVDYIRQIDVKKGTIVKLHEPISANNGFVKDEALVHALSQKRGLEMKEIVATLQREQYDVVTLPITQPIIVQGSAGSGKSAIALHRLSYLLYKYNNLKEDSVAFIGPNEAFLRHIQNVLPTLGNYKVKQITFIHWACEILGLSPRLLIRHQSSELHISQVKGSLAYKDYVEGAVPRIVNDLRSWSKPISVNSIKISVLEVLSDIQNRTDLNVRERENEYYNYYFRNWKNRFDEEMAYQQRVEKWIHTQSEEIHAAFPVSLQIEDSLSDEITQLIKEYNAQSERTEKTRIIRECKYKIQQNAYAVLEQQREALIRHIDTVNIDEMIGFIWSKYANEKLSEAREQFILEQIISHAEHVYHLETIMNSESITALLALREEEKRIELSAEQEGFYSEQSDVILQALLMHTLHLQESELIKRINGLLGRLFTTEHEKIREELVNKAYTLPGKLSLKREQLDEANKILKQHVKNILKKLRYDTVYQQVILLAERDGMLEKVSRSNRSKHYVEDLPALLHVNSLLNGNPKDKLLSYLIVDEAQDYMPYEIAQMSELTASKGMMLIGDLGQNLNPVSSLNSWTSLYDIIGEPEVYELKATFRSTAEIVEVSNKIIEPFAKDRYRLSTQTMIDGEPVKWIAANEQEEKKKILLLLKGLVSNTSETVAVIVKDEDLLTQYYNWISPYYSTEIQTLNELPQHAKVIITTPILAKGLEFNTVILTRFEQYQPNDFDRKLAYVAASRAIKLLYIMFEEDTSLLVTPH